MGRDINYLPTKKVVDIMTEFTGKDLTGEGVTVPIRGGTAQFVLTMYSFVKLEEEFGSITEALGDLSGKDTKELGKGDFTKIAKLLALGFEDYGWGYEDTLRKMLPKHMKEYTEALAAEMNFGGDEDAAPKPQ